MLTTKTRKHIDGAVQGLENCIAELDRLANYLPADNAGFDSIDSEVRRMVRELEKIQQGLKLRYQEMGPYLRTIT